MPFVRISAAFLYSVVLFCRFFRLRLEHALDLDQLLRRGRELFELWDLPVDILHQPVHHQNLMGTQYLPFPDAQIACLIVDRPVKGAEAAVGDALAKQLHEPRRLPPTRTSTAPADRPHQ